MSKLLKLRDDILAKNSQLKSILEAGNDLTAEESKKAGDLQSELKALKANFDVLKSASDITTEIDALKSVGGGMFEIGTQNNATESAEVDGNRVEGVKGIPAHVWATISTNTYRDSWVKYMSRGMHGLNAGELKALQEGIDTSGGFLVPDQIQQQLVTKKPAPYELAGQVDRLTTGRDSLTLPKNVWNTDDIYTSPVRATKTGEIPTSSTAAAITDPVFGQVRIDVFTYMLTGQITRDILEDAMFDVYGFLADQYMQASRLLMENKIINGTGSGEAMGLLAGPGTTIGGAVQPAIVNIGTTAANIAKGIVKLPYAIPLQYEERAVYVFNKQNTQSYIASELLDSQNRFLFAYGMGDDKLASARPKQLVGFDFVRTPFMPNMTTTDGGSTVNTNAYPLIFGDLTGYKLVERVGLSIQVLDQTKATLNQIELVGRLRFGGQTVEDWKIKVGKTA